MSVDLNLLIDLAYIGSSDDDQFDFEYFRLIYCNPRIQFTRNAGNLACVINAYPKGPYKSKAESLLKNMPYTEFLQTAYWHSLSEFIKSVYNFKCAKCSSSLHPCTHHKTYRNRGREIFHLSDLTCLCLSCHNKFHGSWVR